MLTLIKKGSSKREIRKKLELVFSKKKKSNILKFAGKLKSDIDPVEFQKQMRNEWR
jgi:hypothetical protein